MHNYGQLYESSFYTRLSRRRRSPFNTPGINATRRNRLACERSATYRDIARDRYSSRGELAEISGTWKWPLYFTEVGTAAVIYSSFNKQSKFRPSLRPANRSGSTLAAPSPSAGRTGTPAPCPAAVNPALSSFPSPTGVKSLEIDLLSSPLPPASDSFALIRRRDSIIRRVITGEFAAWRRVRIIDKVQ